APSPNLSSSSAFTTSALSRLSTCAVEALKPGKNSSVRAQPPDSDAASRTTTLRPLLASVVAQTSPLWPPPMTTTSNLGKSNDVMGGAHVPGRPGKIAQDFGGGVAAGRTHYAAARMGGRAADVKPADGRAILRVARYRAVEEKL